MSADQIILWSVGSYITTDGIVGPLLSDGLPDISMGSQNYITDCSLDWFVELSEEDIGIVHEVFMGVRSPSTDVWTQCGLNSDWSYDAWHYGSTTPNCVDGDYYVLDMENETFSVVQYFPSREEDCNEIIKSGFESLEIAKKFVEVIK